MIWLTHSVIGLTAVSLILGTADPIVLAIGAIASLVPDIDSSKSLLGRVIPVSLLLEKRFGHRTITHSIVGSIIIALATSPLIFTIGAIYWQAINLAYFCGWYADSFTKAGVCAFYPSNIRLVTPGNYKLRLRSGAPGEFIILVMFAIALTFAINVNSKGGIMRMANLLLAQPEGAIELYRAKGDRLSIFVNITGQYTDDNEQITNKRFELLYPIGTDLLVKSIDNNKLYLAGKTGNNLHIITNKVVASEGIKILVTSTELELEDKEITKALPDSNHQIYVSGSLKVDDNDLNLQPSSDHFEPIQCSDKTCKLEAATPADIEGKLKKVYGTGTLTIREIK